MYISRFLAAAIFATVGAVVAGHAADAQTVTRAQGVTVFRGLDAPSDGSERRLVQSPSGVAVYRGTSPLPASSNQNAPAPSREIITSGRNLWVVDPESGGVTACSIWYDFYGNRVSRCTSD